MEERKTFTMLWKIENFHYCRKRESLDSPIFFADILGDTKWKLTFYPTETDLFHDPSYLTLSRCDVDKSFDIMVDCRFVYLSADLSSDLLCWKEDKLIFRSKTWWNFEHDRGELQRTYGLNYILASQDDLIIRCEIWLSESELWESRFCSATTRIGVERRIFPWIVEEFSSILKERSVQLDRVSEAMPPLTLSIFNAELISCRVQQVCFKKGHHFPYVGASALDASGNVIDVVHVKGWSDQSPGDEILVPADDHRSCYLPEFHITRSRLISNKDLYLPGDVLSLRFEFIVSVGVVSNQIEAYGHSMNSVSCIPMVIGTRTTDPLKKSLQTLYENGTLCDLTLKADGVEFPVHKVVLCSRSPFFCGYFRNVKEKFENGWENLVKVPEAKAATVRHMLQFVYYDVFDVSQEEIAHQLSMLADKYEIAVLKEKCLSFLNAGPCTTRLEVSSMPMVNGTKATDPLKKSLQTLYENGTLCDMTLKADGVEFPVHKVVLCSRSPFFRRRFGNWREKHGDVVDISDTKAATVRHMLRFVYYDVFDVSQEAIACQLFVLSQKYEMVILREKCLSFLNASPCSTRLTEVSVENVRCQRIGIESC